MQVNQKLNRTRQFSIQDEVLNQLRTFDLYSEQRVKINTANGCWFCKKDTRQIIYFVLCSINYPERHIMAAINQLRDHFQKLGDYNSEPQASLKIHSKEKIHQICIKYENIKRFDKIALAQHELNEIRSELSGFSWRSSNTSNNQTNIAELQRKSESLKERAHQFSENSRQLERIRNWRNCKLKFIIGLAIICLIAFIVVPIITN